MVESLAQWKRFRECLMADEATGFMLDTRCMEMDDGFILSMEERAQAAFAAMKELESGAVANPDENRRVGHYWLRAPHLAPELAITAEIERTLDRILGFSAEVHRALIRPERSPRFTKILVAGIGGSALGPQFVAEALGGIGDRMEPFFLDNTDPDGVDRVLERLGPQGLEGTLTLVISKSGGTKETRNAMLEAARAYTAAGLTFARHAVAVTGEGSALDKLARAEGWLARFPMWDWVGGRTSELAAVGLLPAALQGLDVRAMLDGAAAMDALTRVEDVRGNPAMLMALSWHHATGGAGKKDMVVLPYKDRLLLLSRYLQQLVMESLGKKDDLTGATVHQGLAVYGNKGSTDQHAYVQQLRDGVANFFVTFIEVLRDRNGTSMEVEPGVTSGDFLSGFLLGTRRALYESGRPSMTLTVPEVSPRTVGMLMALFERAVGFYASLVGINAYHQPGVEAGKKAAADVVALQRKVVEALRANKDGLTAEQAATQLGLPQETETVYKILQHLSANHRGITRVAAPHPCDARFVATG